MKSRILGVVMLAINLGLAATLVYLIVSYQSSGTFSSPLRTRIVTNTVTQIAVRKINATNSLLTALGQRPLSWQALESTNYVVYMQNLRAFGCPDETILDIILTDIGRLYARRRAGIRAQAPPPKFWQTGDSAAHGSYLPPEVRRQLQDLDREQENLVHELLGVNFRVELARYWSVDEPVALNLGFLPPEKQQGIQAIHDKYAAMEEEISDRARGLFLDEDQAALVRLQKQREAELGQLLSPKELEEYQLRNSETAQSLRQQLTGFQPTEDEFRKIFQLQKTFDDNFGQAFDASDEAALALRNKAQNDASEAMGAEIQKVLGPERFAEYVRAQDDDYRGMIQVAERFNLPREVAGSVYDMKVAAERQKAAVEANNNLNDAQRGQMLAAIARTTEQSVAAALGDKVFKSYQKSTGQWLGNLYQVNENNLALPPEPAPPLPPPLPTETQLQNFLLGPQPVITPKPPPLRR
ncbi:MAG: hypothetical protein QOF48_1079 [Verrucomicrobiota bacterium]|jgi:hypothetical protein